MEHQKAIDILQSILKRYPLDEEEKGAVATAIGMLSWAALSKSRTKAQKARREKSAEW